MSCKRIVIASIFVFIVGLSHAQGLYVSNSKWYQDPLSLQPVQLSSSMGFIWAGLATAACLVFTKKDESFQEKAFLYEEAATSFGYHSPYTRMLQNNTGFMYKLRSWMSVGAVMSVHHFTDEVNNTYGFGFGPFARWYVVNGKKLSPFFEYGAGATYMTDQFPLQGTGTVKDLPGTRFNFTTRYSIGTEVRLTNKMILQGGIRHFHLSNGNIKGVKRNPWHDSNGAFVGLLYSIFDATKF